MYKKILFSLLGCSFLAISAQSVLAETTAVPAPKDQAAEKVQPPAASAAAEKHAAVIDADASEADDGDSEELVTEEEDAVDGGGEVED